MPTIYISTGELSGDKLAISLMNSLRAEFSDLHWVGMGGDLLEQAGVTRIINTTELAVMGFSDIFYKLFTIRRALKTAKHYLKKHRPDLLIVVDYSGFHLRLAHYAKSIGLKVLYYVSPQIWAWRYNRIKKIKASVDHMMVLYPFEEKIYQREHIPVTYVGHPLNEQVKTTLPKNETLQTYQLDPEQPIIGVMPGSRPSEIKYLLPVFMQSIERIQQQLPQAQFVVLWAKHLDQSVIAPYTKKINHLQIAEANHYDLIDCSHAMMVTSGTATLEVALLQTPLLIAYRCGWLNYFIVSKLVKVPFIGLCNLIAEKCVAKEFIQTNACPEKISPEILKLVEDKTYALQIREELKTITKRLHKVDSKQAMMSVVRKLLR